MSVDHTKNIIEVKDVSFGFGTHEVLSHVSINIHEGDYLGIIGPNGSGKSTLLKIILGIIKPTHGSVSLFGKSLETFSDWPSIGYVPQNATHFDSFFPATVKEVVAMGRYGKKGLFHQLNKDDMKKVDEALVHVDILDLKDRMITDLSGGQQQRMFIARALVAQPKIILLDEPTVGVDVTNQEAFYALLRKLNHELNITLVLVSHDIHVVAQEATELACVNKTLVYDDNPKKFLQSAALKKLYGENVNFVVHTH